MRFRTIAAALAVPAALAGVLLTTTGASAAVKPPTATVVASTHIAGVPDTTVGSTATGAYEDANGHVTYDPTQSVYGPVWAIDDVTDTYHVTPLGNNQYEVDRMVNGTFAAFAEPNTGLSTVTPLNGVSGQVHGTISYIVTSASGPVGNLPANEPIATGSHAQLMQLFPGITDSNISGGNDWVFAYHAAGGSMTQRWDTDASTWGNITG
jgi:hypothetical protein